MNTEYLQIMSGLLNKTKGCTEIDTLNKNGVKVPSLTIFEDIIRRNLDNLDTCAIEIINGEKMTYRQFFEEIEKYMNSFLNIGVKKNDVVSLCLPVGAEFICSYFALTTLGCTVNAINPMFLFRKEGIKPYLDEKCSHILFCYEDYFQMLATLGLLNDDKLKNIIISKDNYVSSQKINNNLKIDNSNCNLIDFSDFIAEAKKINKLTAVNYDENRASTFTYTSGTTGKPKCISHSDLAPLFLNAAHDNIKREEFKTDRTLVTIPLQHPTGLFYSMVFQLAQGKTLVLEPRYDKKLFSIDLITLNINHAVQTQTFYSQLVQDKADGKIKPCDLVNFRNAYCGGEALSYQTYLNIRETLKYGGSPNPDIYLGYGRSEEGSLTVTPYNIEGRYNTVGKPLPGIKAKLINPETMEDIPMYDGSRGELLISSPVFPMYHHYIGKYNQIDKSDESIIDEKGVRWARGRDIATLKKMPDGTLSIKVLGRSSDYVEKDKKIYLFDLKEKICSISEIQECEVLSLETDIGTIITAHVVLSKKGKISFEKTIKDIYKLVPEIDAVKLYDVFGINATSGKCDRESMTNTYDNYYVLNNNKIEISNFNECQKRVKKV